jgi:maltokinase
MNWSEMGDAVVEIPASSHPALRELVAAFVSHRARLASEGGDERPNGGEPLDVFPGSVTIRSADVVGPERAGLISVISDASGRLVHAVFGLQSPGGEPLDVSPGSVTIRSAEVVRPGRPGLISVIADVSGQLVHAVFGLRSPGDETQFLADTDDSPLGIFEDTDGVAVVFDATADAELMVCLLEAIGGATGELERVRRIAFTENTVTVTFDDRLALTVFQQLPPDQGPHPGLELFLALDGVGFNHLLAPVAIWRRGRTDLAIVQEYAAGSTVGWSLALGSLRDLYAAGGEPGHAGGDFAVEARRLGTMTARMHLGLEEAFGRKTGNIAAWVTEVEDAVRPVAPELLATDTVSVLLDDLRSSTTGCAAIRTHGDFHLGRVARTDLGWYVLDFSSGGRPEFTAGVVEADGASYRSPLADVADMLWSFHHVALVAAAERDPNDRFGLSELGRAWEGRNRRAFLAAYLATPGIGGLVPPERNVVRELAAAFELERSASMMAMRP